MFTSQTEFPIVPWAQLLAQLQREWRQGEHVAIIGPTGVGKSTLIAQLIPIRSYVVVFVTKIYDETLSNDFVGFDVITEWPPKNYQNKVLLWPKITAKHTIRQTYAIQRQVFQKAMDAILHDKGWTLVFDEQLYICESLGLEPENKMYQHQGRSSKITCINGTQRPSGVPVVTYSGSTHHFIWKNRIGYDKKRLSEIGGTSVAVLEQQLATLSKHEFLYVNSRTGFTARSQVTKGKPL